MNDQVFDSLTEAALGALDDYKAFRAYQGGNQDYFKRAKMGLPVLSTYGRVRATRANERALDMMARRIASGVVDGATLPALDPASGQQDAGMVTAPEAPRRPRQK